MSIVLANLRQTFTRRKEQNYNDQDGQVLQGTLTNHQGLLTGQSLNANGNRAYVGFGGTINNNGGASYNRVVNAWFGGTANVTVATPVNVVYRRSDKSWHIIGMDAKRTHQAGASVQRYNPANINNRVLDTGYILDFQSRPVISARDNTYVSVKPGIVYHNGVRYEYDGAKVDLSAYAPSSAGNHRIAQLWYDPSTNGIQVTTSTEQTIATAFDDTDWAETLVGSSGWLPLQAYKLFEDSDTRITQANLLRDNRPIYTIPTTSAGSSNIITKSNTIPSGKDAFFAGGLTITGGLTVNGELYILP